MTSLPREVDLGLIDLAFDDERLHSSFVLGPPLLRHDGTLYGGTAIAASVMAMEAATQRDVQWVTTQFVAPVPNGETIEIATDVLASGRRTAQVSVTATFGGKVGFTSLGTTGVPRDGGLSGSFEQMPVVSEPASSEGMFPGPPPGWAESPENVTFSRMVTYKAAEIVRTPREGPGTMALWAGFMDGRPMTPAGIAFVADMVPVAIGRAAGKQGAGMSLDNSLRFGAVPPVEWVLLEMQGNLASGGYGHGTVRVWSQDGTLLAIGGQTASMIYLFDEPRT